MSAAIQIDRQKLAELVRRHRIRRLSLFGSVLCEDFRPDGDIDMLVEFEPGARIGLIRLAGIELDLSDVLGRTVDLRTAADLSEQFRDEVLATAEPHYAAS
jgi:predicted nucleotidyltransferase